MEIPINAEVSCADGVCGETICVIVDPIGEQITHVVVQENHGEYTEHLVPIGRGDAEATPRTRSVCAARRPSWLLCPISWNGNSSACQCRFSVTRPSVTWCGPMCCRMATAWR